VAVFHLTATLQMITQRMMSNSRRSAPVMIAHLPIDQAGGKYGYDWRMIKESCGNHPASNIMLKFFI
jgi:hypothetical protein